MKLSVEHLQQSAEVAESMATFGKPLNEETKDFLLNFGLEYVRVVACLKWLWFQWLLGSPEKVVRKIVAAFVDQEMEKLQISPKTRERARHNLLLLHCAIFASSGGQLEKLADQVIDASGFGGVAPPNDGDLYAAAWCGTFKYWILEDYKRANDQAEIVWGAYRPPWLKAGGKPLTIPWLNRDWDKFRVAQKKDFDRLWSSGRKNGAVRKETATEITVTVLRFPIEQVWCWAHCGMALLAYRNGVDVVTDPFWFPPHALKIVPLDK